VVLTLGLPDRSTLESRLGDRAPVRWAHLYSLVVNTAGDAHLEVLTIHDMDGHSIIEHHPSSIEIIGDADAISKTFASVSANSSQAPNGRHCTSLGREPEAGIGCVSALGRSPRGAPLRSPWA
jgi:hypothetical protein